MWARGMRAILPKDNFRHRASFAHGVCCPSDVPYNYIKYLAPKIISALELYDVPPETRPAALGFALQRAIDAGKDVLDPTLAADIAIEFAVPAAKFDPAKFR